MAEGKKEKKSSSSSSSNEESVKLFVGQVPKNMTEAELLAMFKDFALVDEVNIIKDKTTRASRGCCFLICPSRQEADKAVNACHNKKTLPGVSSFFNLISPCIVYYLLFSCFLSHCIVDEISHPGKPLK
ncbi:RNA-binding protein BRN1-like [Populus alba x Populus x berolinensis]|nr:RNA-binding protein BRN1-like [Populus alba x Populus x berolinensis]